MPLTAAMQGAICRWCWASVVRVPTVRHRKVSSKGAHASSNINRRACCRPKLLNFCQRCSVVLFVRTRCFSVYACVWQEDCFAMSCSLTHRFVRASLFPDAGKLCCLYLQHLRPSRPAMMHKRGGPRDVPHSLAIAAGLE